MYQKPHQSQVIVAVIILIIIMTMFFIAGFAKNAEHFVDGIQPQDVAVFLINMERNKERLVHFQQQYNASDLANIPFERIEGVDGNKLNIEALVTPTALHEIREAETTGFRTKHYQLTRGAVGCYMSHLNVYKRIIESDKPYGIIFEDDTNINKRIMRRVNRTLRGIPNTWDILLLGCYCIQCEHYREYSNTTRFFYTHAYIVKRDVAVRILEYFQNKRITQQIDSELSDMAAAGIVRIFCIKTPVAKQSGFPTTIQMPIRADSGQNPFGRVDGAT